MPDTTSNQSGHSGARRVNNYEILDEIGSGGMSRVYRGRRVDTGEIVAIKVIQIENVAPDYERRLRREPEVQSGLGHENIVRLIEWFRQRDEFFLVMEFIEGRSLAQLIYKGSGPMPFARARVYLRQTLRALEHLHKVGIIHRDIKPSNILIRPDDTVKLADFGIAKFTWQQGQTKTQKGLGTPEYMSPEQARGSQIDHRTDIYSLGVTLFEMLTARKPFARDEETPMAYVEVIQSVLTKPLPDPRAFQPGIPAGVVRLLSKATAKNPEDRFQSASEMLGALEVIDDDDYSPATVAVGDIAAPRLAAAPPPRPAQPMRPAARPEPERRNNTVLWIVLLLLALGVGGYFGYGWYQKNYRLQEITEMNDEIAMEISQSVADDYSAFSRDHNPGALASLFAPDGVEYYRLKNATRKRIEDDARSFYAKLTSTGRYDILVKKARALSDSAIQSEWWITYERTEEDGTILRGMTSNAVTMELIDSDWLITKQTTNWTKRDNVEPEPEPIDTVGGEVIDTIRVDEPDTVVPIPEPPNPTTPDTSQGSDIGRDQPNVNRNGRGDTAYRRR